MSSFADAGTSQILSSWDQISLVDGDGFSFHPDTTRSDLCTSPSLVLWRPSINLLLNQCSPGWTTSLSPIKSVGQVFSGIKEAFCACLGAGGAGCHGQRLFGVKTKGCMKRAGENLKVRYKVVLTFALCKRVKPGPANPHLVHHLVSCGPAEHQRQTKR